MSRFDKLRSRGFLYQISSEENLRGILENPRGKSFYIGFDPTADSLHLGSMFALMAISHLAAAGLTPIILMGGGTGLIGDPSGKTEMRNMLTKEEAEKNRKAIHSQIRRILPEDSRPVFVNNADWLVPLNFIEFLRDAGRHFSINRMLTQDSVKSRMEKGISYLEFSYMLLQAYDFAYLAKEHNCVLQVGGADQWGNMVMGMDLARRMYNKDVECFTYELIMTAGGEKMGKSARGAVWLDPEKTSPYEYYQYWINIDDRDIKRFLYGYTFLEGDEIEKLCVGDNWKEAKQRLAFEATKILHGDDEAEKAVNATKALFSGNAADSANVPSFTLPAGVFKKGIGIVDLMVETGLAPSKSEARRLVSGGGVSLNNNRIDAMDRIVVEKDLSDGFLMLRVGKKKHLKVIAG